MITDSIKKQGLKQILRLASNLSDENILRMIKIAEKLFIKDKELKNYSEELQSRLGINLLKTIFKRLSSTPKKKLIESFFLNAVIKSKDIHNRIIKETGSCPPWFFVISPTARCNLNCIGCYAGEYAKHKGLSFELVDKIFTQAKEMGIYFITISGGEPFVWSPLFKILEKHNDMYFLIYTNGTLIDKRVAQRLAELGNAAPGISIEGFEKETDIRRGKGTFNKVMQAMDNLREAGVLFGFSVTPTKLNSEVLASNEFIDLMIEKGCSFGWYFQYVPVGKKPDVRLMSTPEQRNKLRLRIAEIRKSKPVFIGDFWNDGPLVGGCIAGARPAGYFHINSNGDVEPCAFLQFSVDNIKEGKKLIEVINSAFFKAIRNAQPYCTNKNLLTPCALIDHPHVLRAIVKKYNAKPSYETYETITNPMICRFLDNYAKEMRRITDPVWEKEFSQHCKHWKDIETSA